MILTMKQLSLSSSLTSSYRRPAEDEATTPLIAPSGNYKPGNSSYLFYMLC